MRPITLLLIAPTALQTLQEAYECIRLFAANMSERLIAQRQAACA